ncbi:T9SS type A sorting domain-containing protein [Reichenbachiella ulvae]|uniref:T9SS type A sorting domain-containing protein n=1 Tax=Reichenbachiella ulvae TaxID=2980104 RepID=A0ABT3D0G0_9BACT|nr:T9SS type A sorting domain-containing protein [Reichenbachiella ulvae]MCV9389304.1 T9SS type A sorting domain-containing protein [Reichenbachiella ulvae]
MFSLIAKAQSIDGLAVYDWPTQEGEAYLSKNYKVTLSQNGIVIDSKVIYSEGRDEDIGDWASQFKGDRTFNWTMFSYNFSSPLTITVEKLFGEAASEVEVFPSPFEVEPILSNDGLKVEFVLDQPRYVSVNFLSDDNKHTSDGVIKHMMMVFAEMEETIVPDKNSPAVHVYSASSTLAQLQDANVIYFPVGFHDLRDVMDDFGNLGPAINKVGKQVYFEGGAYVHGRITGVSGENVKIYGRGVLTGREYIWKETFAPNQAHIGVGYNNGGYNTVEGIIVCDGAGHGVNLGHHATYQNLKYWGWHPNNDGARPWGTDNKIDQCFFRSCDDALYNKGLTVTETVFWPGFNGSILCMGWDGKYHTENSTLIDNYVIYPEWRKIGNNHGILMSQIDYDMNGTNVTIKNLHVDGNITALVNLKNNTRKTTEGVYELGTDYTGTVGNVSGLHLENITVTGGQLQFIGDAYEQEISPSLSLIEGTQLSNGDVYYFEEILFKNVVIDGVLLTEDNKDDYFTIDPETTRNISFEEGEAEKEEEILSLINTKGYKYILYPNPTTQLINYDEAESDTNYQVWTTSGQLILKGQGKKVDVQHLKSGIYLFRTQGQVFRFVKE